MASMAREKIREKRKKGRQKRTPSPLTVENPAVEDPLLPLRLTPPLPPDAFLSIKSTDSPQSLEAMATLVKQSEAKDCTRKHRERATPVREVEPTAPDPPVEIPSSPSAPPQARLPHAFQHLRLREKALNELKTGSCMQEESQHEHQRISTAVVDSIAKDENKILALKRVYEGSADVVQAEQTKRECWLSLKAAELMFGTQHMKTAKAYTKNFYENTESFVGDHRIQEFHKLLSEYRDVMRHVYRKRGVTLSMESDCEQSRGALWTVESQLLRVTGRCSDNVSVELSATCDTAKWAGRELPRLRRRHDESLANIASDYCMHLHGSLMIKYNLEEYLCAELSDERSARCALHLLFSHLNTSEGYVPELHASLARWTYFAAHRLIGGDPALEYLMLLINHLVRQSRSIQWALPLVQLKVKSTDDVQKTIGALCTILCCCRIDHGSVPYLTNPEHEAPARMPAPPVGTTTAEQSTAASKAGVEAGVEATDADDSWLLVETSGVELRERDSRCTLSEADLLGLLRQLPFAESLQRLMLMRDDALTGEPVFMGDATGGRAVKQSMCGALLLLQALGTGLRLHAAYGELCHLLCRLVHLTLHCIADLHQATRDQCTSDKQHIAEGLDHLFDTGRRVLRECTAHREMALSYIAHLPFQIMSEENLQSSVTKDMKRDLDDTVECYHRLTCITNMLESRPFNNFTDQTAVSLFKLGFCSKYAKLECGAWARSLLARLMRRHGQLYVTILLQYAKLQLGGGQGSAVTGEVWLSSLELQRWRPTAAQLRAVLDEWSAPAQLRALLRNLDMSIDKEVQQELALAVVRLGRPHAAARTAVPEWMYQALIDLRLHGVDWQDDLNSRPAPSESELPDVTPEEESALVCMWTVLTTSWGHSVPLICECGVPMLTRLVVAGRCREAVHCLGFVIIVMVQSPESIELTPSFKTLVTRILETGDGYGALAGRLLGRRTDLGRELLEHVMRTHLLSCYKQLQHGTPLLLLQCWLQLLTGPSDWTTRLALLTLLDTALACCRLQPDAILAAQEHFRECLRKRVITGKSSWLRGSTLEGLVVVGGTDTPHLWLVALRADHQQLERASGLWHKLLWELHQQRDSAVNVDGALKKCGGPPSAEGLAIYRTATALMATPVAHTVHLELWELFFQLYLERPIDADPGEFAPVGPLFFRGVMKSGARSKLTKRLQEGRAHHSDRLQEARSTLERLEAELLDGSQADPFGGMREHHQRSRSSSITEERLTEAVGKSYHAKKMIEYHEQALKKINEYTGLLEATGAVKYTKPTPVPVLDSVSSLYLEWMPSVSLRTRAPRPAAPAAPPLPQPWHRATYHTSLPDEPVQRMKQRFREFPQPLEAREPETRLRRLLPADTTTPVQLLGNIDDTLKELVLYAREFGEERATLRTLDCQMWELLPRLYERQSFQRSELRSCGKQCKGPIDLTLKGEEWCLNPGVERSVADNRRGRRVRLDRLTAPRHDVARLCAKLLLMTKRAECDGVALSAFDLIVKYLDGRLDESPPLADSVQSVAAHLGQRYIVMDAERCARLVLSGGEAAFTNTLLQPALLPPRDLPALYTAILRQQRPPHLTFSHISKFDVLTWRAENPELDALRGKLAVSIFDTLTKYNTSPSDDEAILLELLGNHMEQLLDVEELGVCVPRAVTAASASSLPVLVWPRLVNAVDAIPASASYDQVQRQTMIISQSWCRQRVLTAPVSSLGNRAPHALAAARLAGAYARAALRILKHASPPVQPDYYARTAWSTLALCWGGWLAPWHGERRELAEPLMPWGVNDEPIAAQLLTMFNADIMAVIDQCPGGEGEVLRGLYAWVAHVTSWPAGAPGERFQHYRRTVTAALQRLPWHQHDWFRLDTMKNVFVEWRFHERDEPYRAFTTCVLSATQKWLPLELEPPELSPMLGSVLYLLTDLPFPTYTLEHAMVTLAWERLETKDLEPVLTDYILKNQDKPFHTTHHFQMLCAAATLHKSLFQVVMQEANWCLAKRNRLLLLNCWIRAIGQGLTDADAKGASPAEVEDGVQHMLLAVQDACVGGRNPSSLLDNEMCLEMSEELLRAAAAALCSPPLNTAALPRWVTWVQSAPPVLVRSALRVAAHVTSQQCFYTLSNTLLQRHIELGGSWTDILERWSNGFADVTELVRAQLLYAAYASAQAETRAGRLAPRRAARALMLELSGPKLNVKAQEWPLVMIICFIIHALPVEAELSPKGNNGKHNHKNAVTGNTDVASTMAIDDTSANRADEARVEASTGGEGSVNGETERGETVEELWEMAHPMLQRWSENVRFPLLKKITMQANCEPSDRFRVMAKYALCVVTAVRELYGKATSGELFRYNTINNELGEMARVKAHTPVGHASATCRNWLRDKSALVASRRRHVSQLRAVLFPELAAHALLEHAGEPPPD